MNLHKLIIIGSGPAGLTAAIYAARADLKPLLLAGSTYGGQLMLTTDVGNYPGFPEDIQGPDLIQRMLDQAKRFETDIKFEDVTQIGFDTKPYHVKTANGEYRGDAVILATGASAKWLGLQSEERLRGKGVSSCATCDGFFFKDKKVSVIGGGDTAMEEALFLTKFATDVTVIHRRDSLRASKIMQKRAMEHKKIKFIWDTGVEDVMGGEKVEALKLKNLKTGEVTEFATEGVFIAIGHQPNTKFLENTNLELDEKGYIKIYDHSLTNIDGIFVAGDVHDHVYRQAITAAGAGCRAAMDAERWLAENDLIS